MAEPRGCSGGNRTILGGAVRARGWRQVKRIGREPSPAERGLQLLMENDKILERAARNVYAVVRYGDLPGNLWVTGRQITAEYKRLPERRKEYFRQQAIRIQQEHQDKDCHHCGGWGGSPSGPACEHCDGSGRRSEERPTPAPESESRLQAIDAPSAHHGEAP